MRSVSLREVARATAGTLEGNGALIVGTVGTDTRDLGVKDLFIALKGQRFDGHAFLERVVDSGATAAIVERKNPNVTPFRRKFPDFPLVLVRDSLTAMGDLARFVREGLDVVAVGITGTTGKTCTKDYLVSVLSTGRSVAASPGSYNNEVGIPLTIFQAEKEDRVLVAEMGARHPGDIERLAEIVKPEFGLITNVGPGHLELFKTEEVVAGTKAELARALPEEGVLVLNGDDPWTRYISKQTKARIVRFGHGRSADYHAEQIKLDAGGRPSFVFHGPGLEIRVKLPGVGRHQVQNAVAAAACAHQMGMNASRIARGLKEATLSPWRTEVIESNGCTIINDAYNANPRSMNAAIEILTELGSGRRTIAVLGAMAELGKDSRRYHEEAGRDLARRDVDLLVTVGRRARYYASAAVAEGLPKGSVFRCESPGEAVSLLGEILETRDVILIKASRVAGLESIVEKLGEPCFSREKLVANV
ncbi:MAG TPA: UDP-N-acetylmuramoyl-tripeptide--D-alanyl-D-alanine ligase [Candidatus Anoxymicrobiaceae bacterium]